MKRQEYLSALQQETEKGKKLVYLDESGFSETDFHRYAYAPKGMRVEDKVPSHRYTTTTLIAARLDGCFTAPLLFEGSCDKIAFNRWLSEMLCPLLDDTHVVIMDNASFHKGFQTAETLIRASGASLLFLPPYSPELNPIEQDFANIKRRRQYNAEASIDEIIKVYK
ncbi:MAG: IS630 family transposase [Candidatus Poribacteria bacterium]|nr:IS630 family transposase [Candidatus Poribacteria bacterium]